MTSDEAIEALRAALLKAKREHYYCEDSWYSCPMNPEGTSNDEKPKKCDCGADKFNAEIDRVLLETSPVASKLPSPGASLSEVNHVNR